MKRGWWLVVLGFGIVTFALGFPSPDAGANDKKEGKTEDKKGAVVDLDGLKSRAPGEWKEEEASNRMRLAQFRLPKVKDDEHDSEVVIFKGIGGTAKSNIERWKTFFIPPEGKTIDDVSKVTEIKIAKVDSPYLEVKGTYKYKEQPFDPRAKEELRPNYSMLGVVFEGPKATYHIRLVGPAASVAHYQKGFEEWLKGFE